MNALNAKKCKFCKNPFMQRSAKAVFCSDSCKVQYNGLNARLVTLHKSVSETLQKIEDVSVLYPEKATMCYEKVLEMIAELQKKRDDIKERGFVNLSLFE